MVVEVVGVLSLDLASLSDLLSLAWLPLLSISASYFRYFRVWLVRRLPLDLGVTQWTCSSWKIELGANGFVQDQEMICSSASRKEAAGRRWVMPKLLGNRNCLVDGRREFWRGVS